jgi:hypothetical protein
MVSKLKDKLPSMAMARHSVHSPYALPMRALATLGVKTARHSILRLAVRRADAIFA